MKTRKFSPLQLRNIRRKVMVYAHQIMRHKVLSWSEALVEAWSFIRSNDATLIVFDKVNRKTGERTRTCRIVSPQWQSFYKVKGTGRPLKEGQVLFADLARVSAGSRNVLISTYRDRILESVA